MTNASLEQRVAHLESQMAQLLSARQPDGTKDWRKTLGMFTGDELMWAIDQQALAYRAEDRRRSLAEFDSAQGAAE